jgi:hypothetical protein
LKEFDILKTKKKKNAKGNGEYHKKMSKFCKIEFHLVKERGFNTLDGAKLI